MESDNTVMSLNRLVQLKEDRKLKMNNDNYSFDFAAGSLEKVGDRYSIAQFSSPKVKIVISESPFHTFGKTFNIRVKGSSEFGSFNVVLSHSVLFQKLKKNLFAYFFELAPEFKNSLFSEKTRPVPVSQLLISSANDSKMKLIQNEESNEDSMQSIVESSIEVSDRSLPILFKVDGGAMQQKIRNTPPSSACFDIRGPFGSGLKVSRFTHGRVILFGQGIETSAYIDLIDYIVRFYMYRYSIADSANTGVEETSEIDPFKDDFDQSFNNEITFDFYLTFKDRRDFDSLFLQDLYLAKTIESKLRLGVLGQVIVCLPNVNPADSEKYQGISFTTQKVEVKSKDRLFELLSLNTEESIKKVEKVIACGAKEFTSELKSIFTTAGFEAKILHLL